MYRTDKQFMTNPATASSRIYIGFLPKTVVAQDLEEKFKVHGRILGLVLQQGFAFIQFEQDHQAQTAIESENFTMLHGRKITVKQALDKSQKANQNQPNQKKNQGQGGPPHFQQQQQQQLPQQQQQKPLQQPLRPPQQQQQMQQNAQQPPRPPQQHNQQKPQHNQQQAPPLMNQTQQPSPQQQNKPPQPLMNQSGGPPPLQQQQQQQQQKQQQQGPPPPKQDQEWGRGPPPQHQEPPLAPNARNFPQNDDNLPQAGPPMINNGPRGFDSKRGKKRRMRGGNDRFGGPGRQPGGYNDDTFYQKGPYPPSAPPVIEQPDRNDCEIIVVSKLLTKYAEYIEQRLKSLGLIVDLLFPNEDVPIGRVLANISSRGCLYAILIMPQNEEHRSLTLNVLHGIPQEHRNMPIEDSFIFIMRNFDAYMRGDKTVTETLGPGGVMNISDRHPTNIQLLLNLVAENRQITTIQYDRLLKYLQERKEIQQQHEITEGVDQDSQGSNSKQAELQSRIMNILNKSATDAPPVLTVTVPQPPPPSVSEVTSAPPPLLKDPSVQKALDSLLGGEMFKSMSSSM